MNTRATRKSTQIAGFVQPGFEPVRETLREQFRAGRQIGAAISVWRGEECVVDLWGGYADLEAQIPWQRDTRIVVFSVTKGFVAMAFRVLAYRGLVDFDAPVARYWPAFAQNGKGEITVRTLLNHRAGLPVLERPVLVPDCYDPKKRDWLRGILERQRPIWPPGTDQGYHAITFGLYAAELFRRIAGEELGGFLRRNIFEPTGSDVYLGTPVEEDKNVATLYPVSSVDRAMAMVADYQRYPNTPDARILLDFPTFRSISRRALTNPRFRYNAIQPYNSVEVRRQELAWASATGTARGVARAYIPFIQNGCIDGKCIVSADIANAPQRRQSWSSRDHTMMNPLGWSCGFVKEAPGVFGPNTEAFGHPGLGGTMGWADPRAGVTIGYVHNRMGWRTRPRRTLELFAAIYASLGH